MMKNKLINLLILLVLCANLKLICAQEWTKVLTALRNARPEIHERIFKNWEKKVQEMTDEQRKAESEGIKKQIAMFEKAIDRFQSDEEFRKKVLALNPRNKEILEENLEKALRLMAPFHLSP